jgi:DNA repair exonuclease SbcCD ATPase subunit
MKNADTLMEELRRKAGEMAAESDERLAAVRASIEAVQTEADAHRTQVFSRVDGNAKQLDTAIAEANRELQEFITQTKLFEQADALKVELDQRIAAFRSDMDQLDQRRTEAAELEGQFARIKRLEDEVNNKMTRFLTEQRRLELMETDFNRLLQTSQAVEEKLTQVSTSDDTLQALQVQIHKFNDALTDTEEKYQRIEKKNQTLETTNLAVDRNFKILQDTEAKLKQFIGDAKALSKEQAALRASIDKLSAENEAAQAAADKLSLLDKDLSTIEGRLKEMTVAREWIARAETRENVIKLSRMGWKVDEIATNLKISRSAVELILELGPKG